MSRARILMFEKSRPKKKKNTIVVPLLLFHHHPPFPSSSRDNVETRRKTAYRLNFIPPSFQSSATASRERNLSDLERLEDFFPFPFFPFFRSRSITRHGRWNGHNLAAKLCNSSWPRRGQWSVVVSRI